MWPLFPCHLWQRHTRARPPAGDGTDFTVVEVPLTPPVSILQGCLRMCSCLAAGGAGAVGVRCSMLGAGQAGFVMLTSLGFLKDLGACEGLHLLCWGKKVPAQEMELRCCLYWREGVISSSATHVSA